MSGQNLKVLMRTHSSKLPSKEEWKCDIDGYMLTTKYSWWVVARPPPQATERLATTRQQTTTVLPALWPTPQAPSLRYQSYRLQSLRSGLRIRRVGIPNTLPGPEARNWTFGSPKPELLVAHSQYLHEPQVTELPWRNTEEQTFTDGWTNRARALRGFGNYGLWHKSE